MIGDNVFRTWLGRQAGRNDPVGDIARDVAQDKCLGRRRTSKALLSHLQGSHYCDENDHAVMAMVDAIKEWRRHMLATAVDEGGWL